MINNKIKIFLILPVFILFGFLSPAKASAAASLSLSPATSSVEVDKNLQIGVVLNTGGANTDATDAIVNYDSTRLTLVSAALGDLYENRLVSNTSVAGKITLRASSAAGSYFTGSGTFATLVFKGKATGVASVNFDFTANSSTDCNVAYAGSDILASVANGTYTVVAAGTLTVAPTTGAATGTITPRPTQPVSGVVGLTMGIGFMGTVFLILGALAILL